MLVLGVGVLDADPLRGLLVAGILPGGDVLGRCDFLRLQRRGLDLVGELLGQPPVPGVDLGLDLRIVLEQVGDALGPQRGSGSGGALLRRRPLRTRRAPLNAPGSSKPLWARWRAEVLVGCRVGVGSERARGWVRRVCPTFPVRW